MNCNSIGSWFYDTKYALNCVLLLQHCHLSIYIVLHTCIHTYTPGEKVFRLSAENCATNLRWWNQINVTVISIFIDVPVNTNFILLFLLLLLLFLMYLCFFLFCLYCAKVHQSLKLLEMFYLIFLLFCFDFSSLSFWLSHPVCLLYSHRVCLLCLFSHSVVVKWIIYVHIVSVCVLCFDHHHIEFRWDFSFVFFGLIHWWNTSLDACCQWQGYNRKKYIWERKKNKKKFLLVNCLLCKR